MNPGGPGGSGLGLVTLGQYVPKHAAMSTTGSASTPAVSDGAERDLLHPGILPQGSSPYVPTPELEATWLERSERYADACVEDAAALLPHMTTIDAAKDMDSIRVALGESQINFFGFSYGTYRVRCTRTCSPPTCVDGIRQRASIRRPSGTRPTSTRTSPSRKSSRSGSTG